MSKFSEKLSQLRRQAGLTQAEMAKRLGISKSAVSMYERGNREPELDLLQEMADLFGVSVSSLLGREKDDLLGGDPELTAYLDQYRIILTPAEQQERMKEWVSQYDTDYTAVYCNGCERGIRLGGGHPVHMIELLTRDL